MHPAKRCIHTSSIPHVQPLPTEGCQTRECHCQTVRPGWKSVFMLVISFHMFILQQIHLVSLEPYHCDIRLACHTFNHPPEGCRYE